MATDDDLDQAVKIALEPLTNRAGWELCPHCGVTKPSLGEHECRQGPLELPGLESDEKRRAKSYTVQ